MNAAECTLTVRELNRALSVSESYPDYLERQQAAGILEMREGSGGRYSIRLRDRAKNAETRARLDAERASGFKTRRRGTRRRGPGQPADPS